MLVAVLCYEHTRLFGGDMITHRGSDLCWQGVCVIHVSIPYTSFTPTPAPTPPPTPQSRLARPRRRPVRHQQHHQQSSRRQQQAAAAQTRLPAPAAAKQQQPTEVPAAVEGLLLVQRWLMSTLPCLREMTQMMMMMMMSCWRTLMTMKTWTQSSCSS